MIVCRTIGMAVLGLALTSSWSPAQDLTSYREFQFGMSLQAVAKGIQENAANATTQYQRPALIQTLQWEHHGYAEVAQQASLRNIRFDFYNDELSKMVITYDPAGTEGLTADDMVNALSAIYGTAARVQGTVIVARHGVYDDKREILGRWEDQDYSFSLFRAPYGNEFGLVAFSKKLDLLAIDAVREGDRLDLLDAPARERERQAKKAEETAKLLEQARAKNKPVFRP